MAAVETSQEPPLVPCPPVLPPSTDPEPTFSYPESYDSLSHCVRTNIFPGAFTLKHWKHCMISQQVNLRELQHNLFYPVE